MSEFVPVNEPLLDGNEKNYLNECIDTGWISSEGPFVQKFEAGMAEVTGRRHGIAVCNGTAALQVAVGCLDLKPGDEVTIEIEHIGRLTNPVALEPATKRS